MKLKPLRDRIIVRRLAEESVSPGGIFIPGQAREKPARGEVLAVGPGLSDDKGGVRPMGVMVGDVVVFGKYAGAEFPAGGDGCLVVLSEADVMAVVVG